MAIIEKIARNVSSLPFQGWRRNVYSQNGEDGILERLLEIIGVTKGYFVEFGAWDGKHLSNCAKLADEGWSGCFIEGDLSRHRELEANYHGNSAIATLNRIVSVNGEDRLDSLLKNLDAPQQFEVLSIDVDGLDYLIWESLKLFSPRICVVEFNPTIASDVVYVQEVTDTSICGNSLAALARLGVEKGYSLVAATDWNGIFMRTADCLAHGVPAYRPDEVKHTDYELSLMHGYDGTVVALGHRELLWHGVTFSSHFLQVLPPELRKFPVGQSADYYAALADMRGAVKSA